MFLGNLRVDGLYEENAFTWTLEPHEAVLSLAEGSSTGEGRLVVVLPAGARDGRERRPPRPRSLYRDLGCLRPKGSPGSPPLRLTGQETPGPLRGSKNSGFGIPRGHLRLFLRFAERG